MKRLEDSPVPKYNMEQFSGFFRHLKKMMKLQLSHTKESKSVIACVRWNRVFAAIYSFQVVTSFVSNLPHSVNQTGIPIIEEWRRF